MVEFPVAKDNPDKNKRVICPSCGKSNYKPKKAEKCWHCGSPFSIER